MGLWIARDGITNDLALYIKKPQRDSSKHYFYSKSRVLYLDNDLFPEVTYNNSPRKVKIELI